jgi:hypothetical protein
LRVGQEKGGLDFEGDLARVFGGIDRAFSLGVANGGFDRGEPVAQERNETIATAC